MRIIYFLIFFYTNFISFNIFSQTIVVIDLNYLIDNNDYYIKILKDIELNQEKFLKDFDIKENELNIKLKELEDSKLILSEDEINLQIDNYNNQLSQFTILIEKFNTHYQNQIISPF